MARKKRKEFDFDDLLEGVFDAPFDALDRGFEALDRGFEALDDTLGELDDKVFGGLDDKLNKIVKQSGNDFGSNKTHKGKFTFTDDAGNTVKVKYDGPSSFSIQTTGDVDENLMEEIRRRIQEADPPKSKQKRVREWPRPRTRSQAESLDEALYETMELRHQPLLWSRNWKGERKAPLELRPDAVVSVSAGGMFGRKYTVEVDGVTVYMVKLEELMERYWARGDLDIFTETWTDDEKAVMTKILESLDHVGMQEDWHKEILSRISSS